MAKKDLKVLGEDDDDKKRGVSDPDTALNQLIVFYFCFLYFQYVSYQNKSGNNRQIM